MKKMINEVKIEGLVYQFNLEKKVSKAGNEYISGKVSIATDKECTNIVDIHYTYVVPVFAKSGKPNKTYEFLSNLIDHPEVTVMGGAGESALCVATTGCSLALNEWYDKDGRFVSVMRNEGGFIGKTAAISSNPNSFKADMLITTIVEVETEKGEEPKTIIKGAIFGYNNTLLPTSFSIYGKNAQDYWSSLDVSPSTPAFTTIWGSIVSKEIKTVKETPNAFGEPLIEEEVKIRKEYVITGGLEPIDFNTEDSIYAAEVEQLKKDRELYLANMKKAREEYDKNGAAGAVSNSAKPAAAGEFNF